ncbi:NADH-ubiquinone oxidoreductase subunit 4L [Petrotoga sp. 8T1HF07.NaAc.6.1]|uniref:NADH-quinone oxidoreductase subunit K n=1 Tax=Petrotoga sp. 8T1HF07.NaAc.6.1 TaxID=1351838 RepID=UPI00192B9044|nr:NADH-ubiquinone oxidoreductase subunit 4L [Petrotoga sp. 8T1HF07.NaAc.6.1]
MNIYYIITLSIILIGLFGIITKKDLILIFINLGVFQEGIVLFFVLLAYDENSPIITTHLQSYADPLIHSFLLTVIVIGFANLALMLVFAMILSSKFKTLEVDEIEKKVKKQ